MSSPKDVCCLLLQTLILVTKWFAHVEISCHRKKASRHEQTNIVSPTKEDTKQWDYIDLADNKGIFMFQYIIR